MRASASVDGDREGGSASAVDAGVAELEALVDEWEIGEQIVRGRVSDCGPVRVRAGPEVQAADMIAHSLHDARSRATRALDPTDADLALVAAALGRDRRDG